MPSSLNNKSLGRSGSQGSADSMLALLLAPDCESKGAAEGSRSKMHLMVDDDLTKLQLQGQHSLAAQKASLMGQGRGPYGIVMCEIPQLGTADKHTQQASGCHQRRELSEMQRGCRIISSPIWAVRVSAEGMEVGMQAGCCLTAGSSSAGIWQTGQRQPAGPGQYWPGLLHWSQTHCWWLQLLQAVLGTDRAADCSWQCQALHPLAAALAAQRHMAAGMRRLLQAARGLEGGWAGRRQRQMQTDERRLLGLLRWPGTPQKPLEQACRNLNSSRLLRRA